jgi:hypothetical protein
VGGLAAALGLVLLKQIHDFFSEKRKNENA